MIFLKTKNYKRINSFGFSLIEAVLYSAIFVLILIIISSSIISINNSFREIKVSKNIRISAALLLERVSREVRSAEDVDDANSIFSSSAGKIGLVSNALASTTEIYFDSGKVKIKKDGAVLGDLITSDTVVDALIFNKIMTLNSKAVKVEARIRSSLGKASSTETFYLTSVLRNSY